MCGFIPPTPLYGYQVGVNTTPGFVAGSLGISRDNLATAWKQDVEVLFGSKPGSTSYALTAAASIKRNVDYPFSFNHFSIGPRAHVSYLGDAAGPLPVEAGLSTLLEYSHYTTAFGHLGVIIAVSAGPGYAYNFSSHSDYPTFNLGLKVGWVTD